EKWAGVGSNLAVDFDVANEGYLRLYSDDTLANRTAISTVAVVARAAALTYEDFAAISKTKSAQDSCALVYATDSDGIYAEGHAYEASTSGQNCEMAAKNETVLLAVEKCANKLDTHGAVSHVGWYMRGPSVDDCPDRDIVRPLGHL
ncbi:hypothetical protein BO71DRAFT_336086, partial [Aspergillus ellipticus CBS 707.79]